METGENSPLPFGAPIPVPTLRTTVTPGYWRLLRGREAALCESADDPTIWPEDARAAGMATYRALLEFKDKCDCHCPKDTYTHGDRYGPTSSGPAQDIDKVRQYLQRKYPGKNKVKRPRF